MQPLLSMLRERGYDAKTYVDHGWMLDRAAAARAGLGWLGKNTNLLVPGAGSYVLLAEIVTSAALQPDQPLKKSCGSCDACLRVCPTGALVKPGVLDNRRCISFWTIEHRGVIPREIRPLIGEWIFGCDLCQEICPVNVRPDAPDAEALTALGPMTEPGPRLEELLTLGEETFRARFRQSAVWRTRRSGLGDHRRQANPHPHFRAPGANGNRVADAERPARSRCGRRASLVADPRWRGRAWDSTS